MKIIHYKTIESFSSSKEQPTTDFFNTTEQILP